MGSFLLFILGVAAPLGVALAMMWAEERRHKIYKNKVESLAQDNRGLKLAITSKPGVDPLPAASAAEQREINELAIKLAKSGILLDWLRLGTLAPEEAGARLLGLNHNEASALQSSINEWGAAGAVVALDRLKERLSSIVEMEMVWADPHGMLDRDANAMADRALWVFEPEYVVGEGQFDVDAKLGAVAKPTTATALNGSLKEGEPTLVIELKGARVTIGGEHQMQAWNNVRDLIRGGAIRERDPVDVFVIGGSVDEYEGNPRIEGRHRNVRITSYDYGQLIARAKRLTFGLYDELKSNTPFLKAQRDEILAAQQSAADQAADEASASHSALEDENASSGSDDLIRQGDDDIVREVDYADDQDGRRGDDDLVPHKNAAQ